MAATTSEGTGNGSADNLKPKILNGSVTEDNLSDNIMSYLLGSPQNKFSGNYTLQLSDAGKHIYGGDCNLSHCSVQSLSKWAQK